MPDPVPTQEQLDEATEDFVYEYERRRLNLACRLILSVSGSLLIYYFFAWLAVQKVVEQRTERFMAEFQGREPVVEYGWVFWTMPLTVIFSTLWLLFLWRRPFSPAPIQIPGPERLGPTRARRARDAAIEGVHGFRGFVKSLFI